MATEKSKKKKIIIVCNTLFQIIVAIHLRLTYYKEDEVDLIISNHTNNSKQIFLNAKNAEIFNKVIFLKNKKTIRKNSHWFGGISYQIRRLGEIFHNVNIVNKIARKGKYNELLIANISIFTVLLYNRLLQKNKKIKLGIFEEGISTYSKTYIEADSPSSLHRKFINKKGIIVNVDKLYLFNRNLLEWELPHGDILYLKKINIRNSNFITAINTIFGVVNITDQYDKKIIFFEESHFADGFKVPDVELVNKIADKFGKENIMVKIHPRNTVNRFSDLGYKTNKDTNIPWEVIIMAQDMSDKIFVTISSGSVIYPYLYFGMNIPSYSLINCLDEKPGYMKGDLGRLMQKVYDSNPNVLFAPKTLEDFFDLIKKNNIS